MREGHPAGADQFTGEQAGDQEAGQDEEDVDPDVPTGEHTDAGVEGDYQQDRDRPQSLDVRPEPRPFETIRGGGHLGILPEMTVLIAVRRRGRHARVGCSRDRPASPLDALDSRRDDADAMTQRLSKLSILMPAYNEQATLLTKR